MEIDNAEKTDTTNVSIKKSTLNKLIISVVVIVIISAFLLGYVLGNIIPFSTNILEPQKQNSDSKIAPTTIEQELPATKTPPSSKIPVYAKYVGLSSATINIIEFGDFQCPFCKRFFDQTEPEIKKQYIDTGKAKFSFIGISITGPDSLPLAASSWCANEQEKYYQYHNYIYTNQGDENSGWGTYEKIKILAKNIPDLDMERFNTCLDSKKYEPRVAELTQLSSNIGVTGTPTTFIGNSENGYTKITGAQPYDVFKNVIDKYMQ